MSDGDTVIADEVIKAVPHAGDSICSYDCEAAADYDVTMVRNGNEGTVPACRQCAQDHGVRPTDVVTAKRLFVGDHVVDREDDDATMLVVGLPSESAGLYMCDETQTVADYNPEYPADDDVVECVFPQRTHNAVPDNDYAYPRSRLERVAAVHDVGGDE